MSGKVVPAGRHVHIQFGQLSMTTYDELMSTPEVVNEFLRLNAGLEAQEHPLVDPAPDDASDITDDTGAEIDRPDPPDADE